jgi:PAS domain S-box-containing protein
VRWILHVLLVGVAYFAGARVGYAFSIGGGLVTLWPPSGIILGILLLSPRATWPPTLLGAMVGSFASDRLTGYSLPLALFAAFANTLEAAVAAKVVSWRGGTPVSMASVRSVFALIVFGAVLSNAVTAFVGSLVLTQGFNMAFWRSWFVWWAGDGLGMVVIAPVLLAVAEAVRQVREDRRGRAVELLLLTVVLVVVCMLAFGAPRSWRFVPGPYVTLPVVFWAATRFGPAGAATSVLIVAGFATWYAALGRGPFNGVGLPFDAVTFQVYAFLASASISALFTAAALEERRNAVHQLWLSEERYRTVLETATDAILTIDTDHRVRFANPAVQSIFGYPRHELFERDITLLVPDWFSTVPSGDAARDSRAPDYSGVPAVPLTGRHKDGREVSVEVSFGRHEQDVTPASPSSSATSARSAPPRTRCAPSRSARVNRRSWRRSAGSPAASPTTSTTC